MSEFIAPGPQDTGADLAVRSVTVSASGPYGAFLPGTAQTVATPAGVSTSKDFDYGGQVWNVKAFGAIGDGSSHALSTRYATLAAAQVVYAFATALTQEIDYCAIQAACNAAIPGGTALLPPGEYIISNIILISPAASSSGNARACSILGWITAGRIGDAASDTSPVQLTAGTTFPIGEYILDYVPLNSANALEGSVVMGLGFKCNSRGAGFRAVNSRRFYVAHLGVDHSAIPAPANNLAGPTAAIALPAVGTPAAYSLVENCSVAYAGQDSFQMNSTQGMLVANFSLNAVRYGFTLSQVIECIGSHIEGGANFFNCLSGAQGCINIIGADVYSSAAPTKETIIVVGVASQASQGVTFTGCQFIGTNTGSDTEAHLSMVHCYGTTCNALFVNCFFGAGTQTTDFIYLDAGTTGKILFQTCQFTGVPLTQKINLNGTVGVLAIRNCPGINPIGAVTTPGFLATTVAVTNGTAVDVTAYVTAGVNPVTVQVDAVAALMVIPAAGVGTVRIPAGSTFTPTFGGGVPTWKWYGE
jgi:hypothetical protein